MSSISSINSSANLIYQLQQAASAKQAAQPTAANPQQQVKSAQNDPDHDGDSAGAGGINTLA